MMPHGHGVDNCSLPFGRKGRQLELGESRFRTKIFQQNLLLASHQLEFVGIYVCIRSRAVGDDRYGDDHYGDDGDGNDSDGDDRDGDDGEC
jgi:hypothetical protein